MKKSQEVERAKRGGKPEKEGKLSISVATKSPLSTLVHFALNTVSEGVPVKAAHLKTFQVEPKAFAEKFMASLKDEMESVMQATKKVQPVL